MRCLKKFKLLSVQFWVLWQFFVKFYFRKIVSRNCSANVQHRVEKEFRYYVNFTRWMHIFYWPIFQPQLRNSYCASKIALNIPFNYPKWMTFVKKYLSKLPYAKSLLLSYFESLVFKSVVVVRVVLWGVMRVVWYTYVVSKFYQKYVTTSWLKVF